MSSKGCAIAVLVVVGALALMFACCGGILALSPPANVQPAGPSSPATLANYNRVQPGMSLDDVVAILGDGYTVQADTSMDLGPAGKVRTVILNWQAGGFSAGNCNVTFQNGRVTGKAQAFLE